MLASFYGGCAVGFILGALVILAIVTRPSKAPRVIGSDVNVPKAIAVPAISRRRSWPWR